MILRTKAKASIWCFWFCCCETEKKYDVSFNNIFFKKKILRQTTPVHPTSWQNRLLVLFSRFQLSKPYKFVVQQLFLSNLIVEISDLWLYFPCIAFAALEEMPIAVETDKAKSQHYELPTSFFKLVLGKNLKYRFAFVLVTVNHELLGCVQMLREKKKNHFLCRTSIIGPVDT